MAVKLWCGIYRCGQKFLILPPFVCCCGFLENCFAITKKITAILTICLITKGSFYYKEEFVYNKKLPYIKFQLKNSVVIEPVALERFQVFLLRASQPPALLVFLFLLFRDFLSLILQLSAFLLQAFQSFLSLEFPV